MPFPGGHQINKVFYVLQHLLVAMPAEFDLSTAQHTHSIASKTDAKSANGAFNNGPAQWLHPLGHKCESLLKK